MIDRCHECYFCQIFFVVNSFCYWKSDVWNLVMLTTIGMNITTFMHIERVWAVEWGNVNVNIKLYISCCFYGCSYEYITCARHFVTISHLRKSMYNLFETVLKTLCTFFLFTNTRNEYGIDVVININDLYLVECTDCCWTLDI